jgi:hypothetical protein
MPKETTSDSSEGGLVQLKYTFRFREKFHEPNNDWMKCIEATMMNCLEHIPRRKIMHCPQPSRLGKKENEQSF